jgi:hypothetical protein
MSRTKGTINAVNDAANEIARGDTEHAPMSPIIRLEHGQWMLESALTDGQDTIVEFTLDEWLAYTGGADEIDVCGETDIVVRSLEAIEDELDPEEDARQAILDHLRAGGTVGNYNW